MKAEFGKLKGERAEPRPAITPVEVRKGAAKAEMVALAVLLEGRDYVERAKHALNVDDIRSSAVRDIVNRIFALHKDNVHISPAKLMNLMGANPEAAAIVSEAASLIEMLSDKDRALEDCIARIREDAVKDRLRSIQQAIAEAHSRSDEGEVKRLMTEYGALLKAHKA